MAFKLVTVLALLASAQASPALLNGVHTRVGRAFSNSQAFNNGGGSVQASSNINGDRANAFGSSVTGAQLARDGLYYPGQAIVQTQAYDGPGVDPADIQAKAIAQAQNDGYYHHIPAPANVATYQNFAAPQVRYEVPSAVSSISQATSNGFDESSYSKVHSTGAGVAVSDAQTRGITSTHAKSSGDSYGTAVSNNRYGHGTASTLAKTSGAGSVDTSANSVGSYAPVAAPAVVPAAEIQEGAGIVEAKAPKYVPVYNAPVVVAPFKPVLTQKSIGWRFGTLYDGPSVPASPYVPSSSATSQVNSSPYYGSAKTTANTFGQGVANANANLNAGYIGAKSAATESDYSVANADVQSGGYNNAKSAANVNGYGNAYTSANTNNAGSSAKSTANTNGFYGHSRNNADAHTSGFGSAKSSAKTQGSYKIADSSANSSGYGSANANAQSV